MATHAPPALVLPNGVRLEVVPVGDRESWVQLTKVEGLDGVGIRESSTPVPDGDGEHPGPTRLEARVWNLEVRIVGRDRLDLAERERALRQAFQRSDDLWPLRIEDRIPGGPPLVSMVRVSQPWRCEARVGRGRRLSEGQVTLKAPDPALLETTWRTASVLPPVTAGGIEFPVEYPVEFGGSAYSGGSVSVDGDANTWPQLTVYGPITDPVLSNLTTGQHIVLTGELGADETLVIHPRTRTVLLDGDPAQSRYHWSDGGLTDWWPLVPGLNAIGLSGLDTDTTTRLGLLWRDAHL